MRHFHRCSLAGNALDLQATCRPIAQAAIGGVAAVKATGGMFHGQTRPRPAARGLRRQSGRQGVALGKRPGGRRLWRVNARKNGAGAIGPARSAVRQRRRPLCRSCAPSCARSCARPAERCGGRATGRHETVRQRGRKLEAAGPSPAARRKGAASKNLMAPFRTLPESLWRAG